MTAGKAGRMTSASYIKLAPTLPDTPHASDSDYRKTVVRASFPERLEWQWQRH